TSSGTAQCVGRPAAARPEPEVLASPSGPPHRDRRSSCGPGTRFANSTAVSRNVHAGSPVPRVVARRFHSGTLMPFQLQGVRSHWRGGLRLPRARCAGLHKVNVKARRSEALTWAVRYLILIATSARAHLSKERVAKPRV